MKLIAGSILFLLLITYTFSAWFVVMAFKLNRDYIAKNICENRYRPQLNCKGNCVLMKKMKQQTGKENMASSVVKVEMPSSFLPTASFFEAEESPVFNSNTSYFKIVKSGCPVDRSLTVFHPPSLA